MRAVQWGIRSLDEGFRDVIRVVRAIQRGEHVERQEGTYFTSIEAARNFLTPKRLQLLKLIRQHEPRSVYTLAKLARRDFPSVLREVQSLRRSGLVRLTRAKESRRNAVVPSVNYDTIQLHIHL